MTTMTRTAADDHAACTCAPVAGLLAAALAGHETEPCTVHRPARDAGPPEVAALNDDRSLFAAFGRALGTTTSRHPLTDEGNRP